MKWQGRDSWWWQIEMLDVMLKYPHAFCERNWYIFLKEWKCFSSTHALISFVHPSDFLILVSTCSHFLLLHFSIFHGLTYIHMKSVNRTKHERVVTGKDKARQCEATPGHWFPMKIEDRCPDASRSKNDILVKLKTEVFIYFTFYHLSTRCNARVLC
jgi:hypothetical protein